MSNLEFGDYVLDRRLRRVTKAGVVVPLTSKAFDLLVFMALNAGRTLLKSELMESVWPNSFVEDSNLTQNVFLLRKMLGPEGDSVIATLPGLGYQFTPHVRQIEISPAVAMAVPGATGMEGTQSRIVIEEETEERIEIWRSPVAMMFVSASLALLALAIWLGWQRWEDHIGGPPVQLVMADFEGSTGDAVLDHALTDVVRIDLSQSPFVSVVPAATVRQTLLQMMHKPDDPLTATLARDLCERTGSQAVLRSTVARSGERFLMTQEATSCVDGSTLAAAKREAARREDLPRTIDQLSETLRQRLGESRRTIARFSIPLFPGNTGSIEALEAYSQAVLLSYRGELPEAIGLLNKAVAADPYFAAAHLNLANFYSSMGDEIDERAEIQKAYALRQTASEPVQLYIVAHYTTAITGDLYAAERNYQTWTELYPRSVQAWNGMAQNQRDLGNHAQAVQAAKRALALNPSIEPLYYQLSLEQIHAGDPSGARVTCEQAFARGFDGDTLHTNLLMVAYLQHDAALEAAQLAWAANHLDAPHMLYKEANRALVQGKLRDAQRFVDQADETLEHQGMKTLAKTYAQEFARAVVELGGLAQARALLYRGPVDSEQPEELIALMETGDAPGAMEMLRDQLARKPESTYLKGLYGPQLNALTEMAAHRPLDAIASLAPARAFEGVAQDPIYLRGEVYLESAQPALAEAEFHRILDHPEIEPASYLQPLSMLGIARALAKQNKTRESAAAYQRFLSLWSNANGDSPLTNQARTELAALPRIDGAVQHH